MSSHDQPILNAGAELGAEISTEFDLEFGQGEAITTVADGTEGEASARSMPWRGIVSDPAASFGSANQGGIGREGGPNGMLECLEFKYVAVQRRVR